MLLLTGEWVSEFGWDLGQRFRTFSCVRAYVRVSMDPPMQGSPHKQRSLLSRSLKNALETCFVIIQIGMEYFAEFRCCCICLLL